MEVKRVLCARDRPVEQRLQGMASRLVEEEGRLSRGEGNMSFLPREVDAAKADKNSENEFKESCLAFSF